MAISRQKEARTMPYSYFEWLQGLFIVHSTIGSTSHSMPLNSLEHCIYAQPRWQIPVPAGIRTWYHQVTSPSRYEWVIGAGRKCYLHWRSHKWLSQLLMLRCYSYFIGLWSSYIFYLSSVGIVFWRQTLTSKDWKVYTPERANVFNKRQITDSDVDFLHDLIVARVHAQHHILTSLKIQNNNLCS